MLALVQGGALTARKDRTESAQAAGAAAPSGALVHTAVPVRRAETAPAESRRGSAGHVLGSVFLNSSYIHDQVTANICQAYPSASVSYPEKSALDTALDIAFSQGKKQILR